MLPSSLHFAVTNRPQQGCLATLLNATEAARWVLGPVILMSSPGTDAPQIRSDHGSGLTHGPTTLEKLICERRAVRDCGPTVHYSEGVVMAKSTSTRQQPTHVQIANRAFEIYISRGGEHGHECRGLV